LEVWFDGGVEVWSLRHEGGGDGLHADGEEGEAAAQVGAEAGAESEETGEDGEGGEEEGDDVKGPGDTAEVVVGVAVVPEGGGEAVDGLLGEVVNRAEGDGGAGGLAEGVQASGLVDTADAEPGPSDGVGDAAAAETRGGGAGEGGLEEVDVILGGAGETGEDDEELQDDAAREEDEGEKAEDGTCEEKIVSGLFGMMEMMLLVMKMLACEEEGLLTLRIHYESSTAVSLSTCAHLHAVLIVFAVMVIRVGEHVAHCNAIVLLPVKRPTRHYIIPERCFS
jgi:hypothetical protein